MRIAINAWFLGQETTGSGQYLSHLLPALSALAPEDEFVLVTSRVDGELRIAHYALCIVHCPLCGSGNLSKVWFEQVGFPRACRRLGVDLAHVPYWGSPLFPTVPTVVTVHDLIPLLLPAYRGDPLVRLYTWLVSHSARQAKAILTDSVASQQDIVHHLRIPPERVHPVLLAADERFHPVEDPEILTTIRRKYALPERYFLYLGGFDWRKNVSTILQAFAEFNRQQAVDDPVYLVLAGRIPTQHTDFFPDPRWIARKLGIEERVVFTGWVADEDKPALYSSALAFVFPSWYEGFGLPPLEAMACGIPVIASDRGSLPEVVGEGGILVAPDNVMGLAEAMVHLSSGVLRDTLREKALAQAARFSWRKTAEETRAVYHSVGQA
ncbi:MAG: glycosyltransferase family 4 protein [Anaerolineae bacterium]|jgi:glycosyltransferase involved in cell wall biosynthesis|nr:glycosyltransferase family 4 protein [Anaerolineae bacterium]MDH7473827.1 glycosyltransferase family 1 protein [Anaerolineae bacterium]